MADKGKFFGAWASPDTVAHLRALARLRGVSQSEVLRGLVEDAAASTLWTIEEDPGNPSVGKHNRAGHVLADSSAAAL